MNNRRSTQERAPGSAQWLGVCLCALVVVCCSRSAERNARARDTNRGVVRIGELAATEWEEPLWSVWRWIPSGARFDPVAFRSGAGIVGLAQRSPASTYAIILERDTRHVSVTGGPLRQTSRDSTLSQGTPADIVGVSSDGVVWFLFPDSGRVIGQDVGGPRRTEATLAAAGTATTGCLVGDTALAYLDSARPGKVIVQDLTQRMRDRVVAFPKGYVDGRDVKWSDLRFGGSSGSACVISAPRMRTVMLLDDSVVRPLGAFVEPVPPDPWYRRLVRWVMRSPAPVYAMDATTYPGGVAVLYAGHTKGAGRIVDLYADSGGYLETMVLPEPSRRIAANRERIYALRQARDSILMASYVLPWSIRSTIPPAPRSVTRVPTLQGARAITGNVRLDAVRVESAARHNQ